jgi:hypothetical protein
MDEIRKTMGICPQHDVLYELFWFFFYILMIFII